MGKMKWTESADGASVAHGWDIRPPSYVMVDAAPPKNYVNLLPIGSSQTWQPLEFTSLYDVAKIRTVDDGYHNQLLDQSLQEHEDIWRALAQI